MRKAPNVGAIDAANKVGQSSWIVREVFGFRWVSDYIWVLSSYEIIDGHRLRDCQNSVGPLGLPPGNLSQKWRAGSQSNWAWPRTQLSLLISDTVHSNCSDCHESGHNLQTNMQTNHHCMVGELPQMEVC